MCYGQKLPGHKKIIIYYGIKPPPPPPPFFIELCENGEVDFIDFDTLIEQAPTIERSHKKKTNK